MIAWHEVAISRPAHGRRVLAWCPDRHNDQTDGQPGIYTVAELDSAGVWSCLCQPTHWAALPEPP